MVYENISTVLPTNHLLVGLKPSRRRKKVMSKQLFEKKAMSKWMFVEKQYVPLLSAVSLFVQGSRFFYWFSFELSQAREIAVFSIAYSHTH